MTKYIAPSTKAVEVLRASGVEFTDNFYTHEDGGSTASWARELNIDEHSIVKTILLEADGRPIMVLMHGDMRASVKKLAEITGAGRVTPCPPGKAEAYTGYQVGGVSPFGCISEIPVFMEETILNLRKIYVNGGARGYLVGMDPLDLVRLLTPRLVRVGSSNAT